MLWWHWLIVVNFLSLPFLAIMLVSPWSLFYAIHLKVCWGLKIYFCYIDQIATCAFANHQWSKIFVPFLFFSLVALFSCLFSITCLLHLPVIFRWLLFLLEQENWFVVVACPLSIYWKDFVVGRLLDSTLDCSSFYLFNFHPFFASSSLVLKNFV